MAETSPPTHPPQPRERIHEDRRRLLFESVWQAVSALQSVVAICVYLCSSATASSFLLPFSCRSLRLCALCAIQAVSGRLFSTFLLVVLSTVKEFTSMLAAFSLRGYCDQRRLWNHSLFPALFCVRLRLPRRLFSPFPVVLCAFQAVSGRFFCACFPVVVLIVKNFTRIFSGLSLRGVGGHPDEGLALQRTFGSSQKRQPVVRQQVAGLNRAMFPCHPFGCAQGRL